MNTFFKKYSLLLPVLAFVSLLLVGWGKWGNLIIDNYRDPWLALEILKGKVLYRDLDYLYGLFTPYLISWLFKFFGAHFHVLYLLGISSAVYMAFLEYKLLRFFFSRPLSSVLLAFFIMIFLLGTQDAHSFSNFIFPYTYSSTLCMCSLMTALYAYLSQLKKQSLFSLFLWSAGMSTAFLFRMDLSLIALAVFILLEILFMLRKKNVLSYTLVFPALICVVIYSGFILSHQAFSGFKDSILDYYLYILKGRCYFNAETMGLHQFPENIMEILRSVFILSLFAFTCRLSLYFFQIRFFFAGACGILLCFFALKITPFVDWFRGIPILCFLIFIFLLFSLLRKKTESQQNFLITDQTAALSFFSFAISFRVLFKAGPDNYGFFLLDPGLICLFILLFKICPSWDTPKFPALSDSLKIKYKVLMLILLSVLFFPWISRTLLIYSIKTVPIVTRFGTLYCEPIDRTENFLKTADYLKNQTAPISKVIVFPEGILLNLLSKRQHPLRYAEFLPHGIERFGEERLIREMEEQGTDYIVLLNLQTIPYEFHYFGIDYAVKIKNWIQEHYEQCALFGPMPYTDEGFGLVIFKRKNPGNPIR